LIRNTVALLFAAAGMFAGVLLYNVATHSSRQIEVPSVPRVPVDEQAAATRLSEAIRFQTISNFLNPDSDADALRGLQAHIAKSFPVFHAAARREVVATYSVLYTWEGSDPKAAPIALLAHQDVVPVAPGTTKDWQQPPFDGVIADGFIWGRGSWDDKGNLYSMLEAAEQMAKQGFLIAEGLVKGLDRPAALIGVAEKGYATLVLTAHATPGHSSMPPRDTAIGMMSAALARLEDNRLPTQARGAVAEMFDTLAPEMKGFNRVVLSNLWLFKPLLLREFEKTGPSEATIRTTTALTIFNAGDKDNVLPGNAEATVNFRLIPGDTQASVTEHVRHTIANDRISIEPFPGNADPPPVTATSGESYRALNRTIREIFPDVIVAPGLMVAGTDSRHYTGVTDTILRFTPVRANADDLKRFHGTNERLSIEGYADMIRFYRRLIESTAG
jgi:carboxypeptidase PM20D1